MKKVRVTAKVIAIRHIDQGKTLRSGASGLSALLWRDISTAPRDGTRFLACSTKDDYEGVETLMWIDDMMFNVNSNNETRGDWWTHWMPKPPAP
ncbi:MAG: hypothetical protein KAT62_03550 [Desulfuromonadales bacterium]|nr:hypothetical protein [Desulfuromonadales bacterium]